MALCPYYENLEIIKEMVKANYGFTVTRLKRLNGYDDLNFHVLVAPDHSNPHLDHVSPNGYFMKIANFRDSQRPEFLGKEMFCAIVVLFNTVSGRSQILIALLDS